MSELNEEMQMAKVYKKLSDCKGEFGRLVKDKENPFHKSKYLSLNGLLATIEPVLLTNGMVMLQPIQGPEASALSLRPLCSPQGHARHRSRSAVG